MIGIIDYGMGNLRSVQKAFEFLGKEAIISADQKELMKASHLVLPGVGAFRDAIATLKKTGLDKLIQDAVAQQTPLLGICLGMQLLFEESEENGHYQGLGLLPGRIVHLPPEVKAPQIGWNDLIIKKKSPLFDTLPPESYVYFVHSYYLETTAPIVSATCLYGKEIAVAAQQGNIFAVQFHPEKSGEVGLKILEQFGRI
ncbi:MAG TPA: imidazole glycerol phosphate synthase subunit HisH [Firmicutes bacterium]|nr:imidazole glycerol phosphate synthase subunit HisH [Bacillota bacterium]